MKICKNQKKLSSEKTNLNQSDSQLQCHTSDVGIKSKERHSIGGRVNKREKRGSNFTRFTLRKLFRGTSVAPHSEQENSDAGLADISPGDSGCYRRYEGVSDASTLSEPSIMTLDAGHTPPKRGRLRKVDSAVVMEKILGRFVTSEAGSTPKERGRLKTVNTHRVLELLVGKENMELQSPFCGKSDCATLSRSILDESKDNVKTDRKKKLVKKKLGKKAEKENLGTVLCGLRRGSNMDVSPAEPLPLVPRRSPRFSGKPPSSQLMANSPPVVNSTRKRYLSQRTYVSREAGSTPKRSLSTRESKQYDLMRKTLHEQRKQTDSEQMEQMVLDQQDVMPIDVSVAQSASQNNSLLGMSESFSGSNILDHSQSNNKSSLNTSKVHFAAETEMITDPNMSSINLLSRQMERLSGCLTYRGVHGEGDEGQETSSREDSDQHSTTTCNVSLSLRRRSFKEFENIPGNAHVTPGGTQKKIPPKKPPRKKKVTQNITVTARDAGHTPRPQRKTKETYDERLV